MKTIIKVLVSILAVIAIIIGGWKVKEQVEYNQMVKIVQSEEVAELIKEEFRHYDPHAFTSEGKVKSYEIDLDSIEHNPMGGFMFDIIVNEKKELNASLGVVKDYSSEKLRVPGVVYSQKLAELIGVGEE